MLFCEPNAIKHNVVICYSYIAFISVLFCEPNAIKQYDTAAAADLVAVFQCSSASRMRLNLSVSSFRRRARRDFSALLRAECD